MVTACAKKFPAAPTILARTNTIVPYARRGFLGLTYVPSACTYGEGDRNYAKNRRKKQDINKTNGVLGYGFAMCKAVLRLRITWANDIK